MISGVVCVRGGQFESDDTHVNNIVWLPVWTSVNVYLADSNLGKKNRKKHNKAHRRAFVCVSITADVHDSNSKSCPFKITIHCECDQYIVMHVHVI